MIIVKGKSILDYWATDLPDDYFINTTSSGYSTDLTAFHWIQHFEKQTKARTKGLWRLLLLDGHGSHDTREFLEYCELHRILAVALPPHTTHLLQPLDVGCFQPLKWYHGKTLDWAARTGAKEITKDDFFATLDEIRRQTFTYNTIRSGWRRTGLAPWAPEVVLAAVRLIEVPRVDLQPAEVYRDNAGAPDDLQDWRTPRTTRVLNNQLTELQQRLWEDYDVDDDLLSALDTTYKGALAMAQATQGLTKALQQTKAAEIARAERRERAVHRRRLNEGGPLYAKDARRMVIEREQDELIEIQRKLQERNLKSIKRLITALKLSTIRRLGKLSARRHIEGTTIQRTLGLRQYDISSLRESAQSSWRLINSRSIAERWRRSIIYDPTGAAWLGLAARQPYDPYTIYIATRDTTALKVRQQQERAQAEEVAMFDTQQTAEQDAESSEESSVGYSSPLSRFYNDDLLDEHHSNKARDL
ncbi:hypothetical protein COCSADRAFT_34649 [Bipolaris sorokiniana ND90Pr]|uniref:DDE-1 domain-containing protein n=1 Tax=Cochliobolus sativus (strain ND90Pr / ATCC 201652) TaxID=665912 RepID=M2SFN4_COCSN|nr:uncharacterized protein COCSADRAFT_34649 [Bipolaris sorokiniana ND90Pr]EMD66053.1 hypothetical protein COCSADRAFT_34649 [Bipolaris sorokiniana ND90Pr]